MAARDLHGMVLRGDWSRGTIRVGDGKSIKKYQKAIKLRVCTPKVILEDSRDTMKTNCIRGQGDVKELDLLRHSIEQVHSLH